MTTRNNNNKNSQFNISFSLFHFSTKDRKPFSATTNMKSKKTCIRWVIDALAVHLFCERNVWAPELPASNYECLVAFMRDHLVNTINLTWLSLKCFIKNLRFKRKRFHLEERHSSPDRPQSATSAVSGRLDLAAVTTSGSNRPSAPETAAAHQRYKSWQPWFRAAVSLRERRGHADYSSLLNLFLLFIKADAPTHS